MLVEVAPYWNVNNGICLIIEAEVDVEVAPYWNVNLALLILTLAF